MRRLRVAGGSLPAALDYAKGEEISAFRAVWAAREVNLL